MVRAKSTTPKHSDAAAGSSPGRPRSRRRAAWAVLGLLVLVLAGLVVRLVWQAAAAPAYWDDHRVFLAQTPEPELQAMAARVEQRLPGRWTAPIGGGDGVRQLRADFDEVNAWLAMRLESYLANQGLVRPAGLGPVMVREQDGQLVAAFEYDWGRWGKRVVSLRFAFEPVSQAAADDGGGDGVGEGGSDRSVGGEGGSAASEAPLGVRLTSASLGRRSLPLKVVLSGLRRLPGAGSEAAAGAIAAWEQGEAVPLPTLPVDASRQASVTRVRVEPEGVSVTARARFRER